MATLLHHRGPDAQGIFRDRQCGLAHARLSIIDLSGGAQPMMDADEACVISYNGEVFNYRRAARRAGGARASRFAPRATPRSCCRRIARGATPRSRASTASSRSRSGTAPRARSCSRATGSACGRCTRASTPGASTSRARSRRSSPPTPDDAARARRGRARRDVHVLDDGRAAHGVRRRRASCRRATCGRTPRGSRCASARTGSPSFAETFRGTLGEAAEALRAALQNARPRCACCAPTCRSAATVSGGLDS